MRAEPSRIPGCSVVELVHHTDDRGSFVKLFRSSTFVELGLDPTIREVYWSTSARGVVRGLHFQTPPDAHAKTVGVVSGTILDVVLDLRAGSPTYGEHAAFELDATSARAVHVPLGCAHGFQALSDGATVAYLVGTEHAPEHDAGIRWDSAGIAWPLPDPVVSGRDLTFPALAEFETPFGFVAPEGP
jgi:dTDP-4-dehydrorhamnose 3,5-epimerase